MKIRIVIPIFCLLLSGCFGFQGGRQEVSGEKMAPGDCRQAGIIELAIQRFRHEENGTFVLEVALHNLKNETITAIGVLGIYGTAGGPTATDYMYYGSSWQPPHESNNVPGQEHIIMTVRTPHIPPTPWREITLEYDQGGKDPVTNPSLLRCSLAGDNAPWAFAAKS